LGRQRSPCDQGAAGYGDHADGASACGGEEVIDAMLNTWLNVATLLALVGAAFYCTLFPYMTRDE
jgi:hypothetical protein